MPIKICPNNYTSPSYWSQSPVAWDLELSRYVLQSGIELALAYVGDDFYLTGVSFTYTSPETTDPAESLKATVTSGGVAQEIVLLNNFSGQGYEVAIVSPGLLESIAFSFMNYSSLGASVSGIQLCGYLGSEPYTYFWTNFHGNEERP